MVRFRMEAGFKTAHNFFNENGGKAVMGLTYRKYLLLEQGKNLPALHRLPRLSLALRLEPQSPRANGLTLAWLHSFAGEDVYRDVLSPVIAPSAEGKGASPLHKALEKSIADKKYFISPAQYRAILSNFETYLCHLALSNESGAWAAADLAKALRLDRAKTAAALKVLVGVKVVKETRKGVFKSPLAGRYLEVPQLNIAGAGLDRKQEEYNKTLFDSGRNEWYSTCLLRAESSVFRGYLPLMNLNMQTAATYCTYQKTPGFPAR